MQPTHKKLASARAEEGGYGLRTGVQAQASCTSPPVPLYNLHWPEKRPRSARHAYIGRGVGQGRGMVCRPGQRHGTATIARHAHGTATMQAPAPDI